MESVGHVFIAWGRNEDLANATAKALRQSGIKVIVGGAGSSPNSAYVVAERVRQALLSAGAVLLLVEDASAGDCFADRGIHVPNLRPNLIFEWGFALSSLPQNLVFAMLIGIDPSDLPTDLHGTSFHLLPESYFSSSKSASIEKINYAAGYISQKFLEHLDVTAMPVPSSPFEVIRNWPQISANLMAWSDGKRGMLSRHAQEILPHLVIPAVYDGQISSMRILLKVLFHPHDIIESSFVDCVLRYYELCRERSDSAGNIAPIVSDLMIMNKSSFKSNWAKLIHANFLGVIALKIARKSRTKKDYQHDEKLRISKDNLDYCRRLVDQMASSHLVDSASADIWMGFIYWNLSRLYRELGKMEEFHQFAIEARDRRRAAYTLIPLENKRIRAEFLFEYYTVELELAMSDPKLVCFDPHDILIQVKNTLGEHGRAVGRVLTPPEEICREIRESGISERYCRSHSCNAFQLAFPKGGQ